MKKFFALLLTLCMVLTLLPVTAMPVSAEDTVVTRTINVGVISYILNENNLYDGWYVHYSDGATGDAECIDTEQTTQMSVGESYWNNEPQTFRLYTAEIPVAAKKITIVNKKNGDRWFSGNGDGDATNYKCDAYVFNYGQDRAYYDCANLENGKYLIGTFNDWTYFHLTAEHRLTDNNDGTFSVYYTFRQGDKLKVVDIYNYNQSGGGMWWKQPGDQPVDSDNNRVIEEDGEYRVVYTAAQDSFTVEKAEPKFTGASLTLKNGELVLNFYAVGVDTSYTVDFNGPNGEKTESVDANGKASYAVYYKDYDVPVTAELKNANGETVDVLEYSVNTYLNPENHSDNDVKKLVTELAALCQNVKATLDTNVTAVEVNNTSGLTPDDFNMTITSKGCYYGISLLMKEKITLRLYFKNPGVELITIDGVDQPLEGEGTYRYYDFKELSATALGQKHTVALTNGDQSVEITNVCALTYAAKVLKNSSAADSLKYVANGLFNYYQAAKTCFPSAE